MHRSSTAAELTIGPLQPAPPDSPVVDVRARMSALLQGSRGAAILYAAAELNLFAVLRDGPKCAGEVAAALGLDQRATGILLEALDALELLDQHDDRYANSDYASRALLDDAPESIIHNLRYQARVWTSAGELVRLLRTGRPDADLLARLHDSAFTRDYILGLRELARVMAPEVAAHLAELPWREALDLGGGSGSYSLALLAQRPSARLTLLDLPGTLQVARAVVAEQYPTNQLVFQAGNYLQANLQPQAFDLALLSHVTHDESATDNQRLLSRVFAALKPGGRVAIHDFVLEHSGRPALFPALFAVHLLLYTAQGRVYRGAEYRDWLQAAGFRDIVECRIGTGYQNESRLLIGTRRGGAASECEGEGSSDLGERLVPNQVEQAAG